MLTDNEKEIIHHADSLRKREAILNETNLKEQAKNQEAGVIGIGGMPDRPRGMNALEQYQLDAYLEQTRHRNHDITRHHQPDGLGLVSIRNIRLAAENFMNVIDANTSPGSKGCEEAKNKVSEALMLANRAVVLPNR